MNVRAAWSSGYTGKGVLVAVVDDGVNMNHPDLEDNFNVDSSYDFLTNKKISRSHSPGRCLEVLTLAAHSVLDDLVTRAYSRSVHTPKVMEHPVLESLLEEKAPIVVWVSLTMHKFQVFDCTARTATYPTK